MAEMLITGGKKVVLDSFYRQGQFRLIVDVEVSSNSASISLESLYIGIESW